MIDSQSMTIPTQERTLAALTHLSGLAGYIIPFGGVIVPIVIWIVKSDVPVISRIAQQALLLNIAVFVLWAAAFVLWITIVLIPAVIVFWIGLALVAVVLPIVGAIKAWDGEYYRYPVIGNLV